MPDCQPVYFVAYLHIPILNNKHISIPISVSNTFNWNRLPVYQRSIM